jgi:hypothetical protein
MTDKCLQKDFLNIKFKVESKFEIKMGPFHLKKGSSVAAWLSCSEAAVPALVGLNLTEGGGFFPRKEPPPGHGCVCVFQGLTVGWWKEERHSSDTTAKSVGFKSQAGWASHGCLCCIRVVLSRKEKGEERVGVGGRGKYPGAPAAHKEKKRKEKQADGKVTDRPVVVKGERL